MLTIDIQYSFDLELMIEDYNSIKNNVKGVYFFYDWDDNLLYVDSSEDINWSMYYDIRCKRSSMYKYRSLIRYVKIVECNCELEMKLLKNNIINTLSPTLNNHDKTVNEVYLSESKLIEDRYFIFYILLFVSIYFIFVFI